MNYGFNIGESLKDSKRDLTITRHETRYAGKGKNKRLRKWYGYTCNKCGWDKGVIDEGNLFKVKGCACCAGKTVVQGINDIASKAPWMIIYFQGGYDEAKCYTIGSSKKIFPKCPHCTKVKSKPMSISTIYRFRSIGCSCSDGRSYPHKYMRSVLEQIQLECIEEYSPSWLERRSFDFYLPSREIIIEMDGGLGHGKAIFKNSKTSSSESLRIDMWKDAQAEKHGLRVFRIESEVSKSSYMSSNIKAALSQILNLRDVDWLLCDKWATKNLHKEICVYYEKHKPIETKELACMFGMSKWHLPKILAKGRELGWCTYNPISAFAENLAKIHQKISKKIDVYKDGVFIASYPSMSSLARNSFSDFGVKFCITEISRAANGKRGSYKGYKIRPIGQSY